MGKTDELNDLYNNWINNNIPDKYYFQEIERINSEYDNLEINDKPSKNGKFKPITIFSLVSVLAATIGIMSCLNKCTYDSYNPFHAPKISVHNSVDKAGLKNDYKTIDNYVKLK